MSYRIQKLSTTDFIIVSKQFQAKRTIRTQYDAGKTKQQNPTPSQPTEGHGYSKGMSSGPVTSQYCLLQIW